jgi:nucleotide-binding universal stress UspA family protein
VVESLARIAEEEGAKLIVVGSSHRAGLGRMRPGGTGRGLVHATPTPIAIAPRGYRDHLSDHLRVFAVAYDGSPQSKAALRLAIQLAEQARATLRLFSVAPSVVGSLGLEQPITSRLEYFESALAEGLEATPPSLRPVAKLLRGAPAECLLEELELGVSLLVIGTHGEGRIRTVVFGSVSSLVVERASCPVVLVTAEAGEASISATTSNDRQLVPDRDR